MWMLSRKQAIKCLADSLPYSLETESLAEPGAMLEALVTSCFCTPPTNPATVHNGFLVPTLTYHTGAPIVPILQMKRWS